jgi:hypothetical protein
LCALALGLLLAGLLPASQAQAAGRLEWPTVQEQLTKDHVQLGSALERLIVENQDFSVLHPKEFNDHIRIPLWLRVLYRKQHPHDHFSPADPTGGYPLVLHEVWEWMVSHQDLKPGRIEGIHGPQRAASETGEMRISGAQTSPRSESDIRVNYLNPQKIIGASNNISSTGRQAMFFSSNGGASWGQTLLPLVTGDAFMSDPTVDWTSDGTAWSTTIGIDSAATILKMRSYKSTDGGATWTFDATFSGSATNNDKQMMWVDHSATSPFKDNIYVIWHPGAPAVVARRTGPAGSWQPAVQVSGAETTGTAIGDDIKTNSFGDVFGFFPDSGSRRLNVVKSTNGGASFSAPVRIATGFASFQFAIPADASRQVLVYLIGGAFRTSTKNNVYAAWNDLSGDSGCTSGGGPGTNAASTCKSRLFFSRSTDGGTTWSAPVKVNNQSGLNDQFNPWMVVDESNGKIALMYYDTVGDSTRKTTNVYYQSSTDDGVTWSTPFKVTTAATNETTTGADTGNQYGDYNSLSGISGTFFPSWTDRRSGASEEIWTAAIADGTSSTPDFSISASPAAVSIAQGGSGSSTVTTSVSGGFNNAISLSASGQPAGVTAAFSPTSIAAPGSGSSTLTFTVGASTVAGTYPITVTGTGGSTTHTTTVNLTVTAVSGVTALTNGVPVTNLSGATNAQQFFSLAVPAGATNLTFQISGGTGDADLYVRFGAQPTTTTWDCRPFVSGNAETCTFAAPQTGTYFVMLNGFAAYSGVTLVGSYTSSTPDFAISASPSAVSIAQGGSGNSTITTTVSGGFNSAVALSASGQPAGVTVGFSPASIAAPGSGSSTLTFTVAASTVAGTYPITVTGTGGGKTHTATVNLTVTSTAAQQLLGNPGFENGSASPAPWVPTTGVIDNTASQPAHSGTWKAWMNGYGTTHTDTLYQQVTIPSTATTATLTFFLHIDTAETTTTSAFDTLNVQVRNSSNTVLSTLATYSNLNAAAGYSQKSFNLISFKGQTIRVYFLGVEDSSLQTSFVVDDTALNVQ